MNKRRENIHTGAAPAALRAAHRDSCKTHREASPYPPAPALSPTIPHIHTISLCTPLSLSLRPKKGIPLRSSRKDEGSHTVLEWNQRTAGGLRSQHRRRAPGEEGRPRARGGESSADHASGRRHRAHGVVGRRRVHSVVEHRRALHRARIRDGVVEIMAGKGTAKHVSRRPSPASTRRRRPSSTAERAPPDRLRASCGDATADELACGGRRQAFCRDATADEHARGGGRGAHGWVAATDEREEESSIASARMSLLSSMQREGYRRRAHGIVCMISLQASICLSFCSPYIFF
jgi:hypothetical protein